MAILQKRVALEERAPRGALQAETVLRLGRADFVAAGRERPAAYSGIHRAETFASHSFPGETLFTQPAALHFAQDDARVDLKIARNNARPLAMCFQHNSHELTERVSQGTALLSCMAV